MNSHHLVQKFVRGQHHHPGRPSPPSAQLKSLSPLPLLNPPIAINWCPTPIHLWIRARLVVLVAINQSKALTIRQFLNKLVLSTSTSSGAHGKNGSTRNRKQVAQSSPLPRNFKPKILATSSTQPSQGQTGLDMFPSLESLSQQGINNLHGQPHRLARPSVLSPPKPTQQEDTEDEDSSDSEDESIPQNRRAGAGLLPSRRKSGLASFA